MVDFGLPNATIHAVDERATVEDIEALSRIYERVMERYFAGVPGEAARMSIAP